MKYALHSVVFGLFLVSTAAIADDLPTFRLLMKDHLLCTRKAQSASLYSLRKG